MGKVKFKVLENKKVGTHSFYAVPVVNGTLSFADLCEEACDGKSVEPSIMKACVSEYMKVAARNMLKGFRVPLGEEFLYLYPNLRASVKDVTGTDGAVTRAATSEDIDPRKGVSRVGCTVSRSFSKRFAAEVSWTQVDARTGEAVNPDEDVTDDTTASGGSTSDAGTGSQSSGGSSSSGGEEEGGEHS